MIPGKSRSWYCRTLRLSSHINWSQSARMVHLEQADPKHFWQARIAAHLKETMPNSLNSRKVLRMVHLEQADPKTFLEKPNEFGASSVKQESRLIWKKTMPNSLNSRRVLAANHSFGTRNTHCLIGNVGFSKSRFPLPFDNDLSTFESDSTPRTGFPMLQNKSVSRTSFPMREDKSVSRMVFSTLECACCCSLLVAA